MNCLCGHPVECHALRDPNWRVGDLVEKFGACPDCDCKGQIWDAFDQALVDRDTPSKDDERSAA